MAGIRYKGQIFSGAASFGDADHVAYDNTESGLEATDVQGALDEVSNAENVSYDNTESGLTATNVQDAVDELKESIAPIAPIAYYSGTTFSGAVTLSYANKFVLLDVAGFSDSPNTNANHWFGFQWLNINLNYGFQITFSFGNDHMYIKRVVGGTWTQWAAI